MLDQTIKTLSDSDNWGKLVHNIKNSLGRNYEYSVEEETGYIGALYEELGSDPTEMARHCQLELEASGDYEEIWGRIKAAAVILTWMGQRHHLPANQTDVVSALWKAANQCGVGSWQGLGHDREDGWENWQKHKYPMDSIFFALANLDKAERRLEMFFNSPMTNYWKSFYIDWDVVWTNSSPEVYLSAGGHRLNHKIIYYELLAFRLANYETEFERHTHKVDEGLKRLAQNPDDIPADRVLRKQIYDAMTFYYQGKRYEGTQIVNEVFNVLRDDTIGFILSDPQYQQPEAGKVLLSTGEILENTWDTNNRLRSSILPVVLAAINHTDSQVRLQAKGFLKVRAPHTIQEQIEGLINKLDSASSLEKVSDFISNLIEFGSQVAIKAVLRKCVIWIASDENWILVDRAGQKLRMTPSSIQPLVYQLNIDREDKQIRDLLRTKILVEQDNFALNGLFHQNDIVPDVSVETPEEIEDGGSPKDHNKVSDTTVETPFERFKNLPPDSKQRYLEHLEKWCKSFESQSNKTFADHIATWQENIAQGKIDIRPRETIDLAEKLLDLLTQEKVEKYHLKVQLWITDLLSHMSDRRYFENEPQLYEEMAGTLEKFAIEPLSKRLPTENNLDIRENIVRVLGNVGGPAAVDALVRTVSGKERERKERQALLAEYYLEPSKERSEEAAALLNDAVDSAKKTMRLLQILNVTTFALGAVLLIGGVIVAVISDELATRFVGFISGLGGIGAIVTIFLKDPLKRIQTAMGNLVQTQTAFTGFVWDLNLNGTYIQSQYVAEGILTDYDIRQTTRRIAESIDKTMNLIQVYTEDDYVAGPPNLSYMLPPSGSDGTTFALFGENLRGKAVSDKKAKCQIAINHNPIDTIIGTWTDHYVIFHLAPQMIESLKTEQSGNSSRLWISFMIDDIETNAFPFSFAN